MDAGIARATAALVALAMAAAVGLVASAPVARAQAPVASLQVTDATLQQIDDDLQFALSFNRAVPVADVQPRRGRIVCVVLSPDRSSRRRACVSRRDGRLRATLAPIDETGAAVAPARPLRGARVAVRDAVMTLRAPAGALHVRLGAVVSWHAYLQWQDGSGCALVPGPGHARRSCRRRGR